MVVMKKKYLFFILLLTAFTFNSCDIKHDFTFTFETPETTAGAVDLSFSEVLDATVVSSEFSKYKNDIDKIEISRVRYLVTQATATASARINSIQIKVGDVNDNQSVDLASANDIALMSVAAVDQEVQMNQAGKNRLNDLLKNSPHKAKIYVSINGTSGVTTYKVKLKIDVKVTYKKSLL
jgi:hypothetical protein